MARINSVLDQRLKKPTHTAKMTAMAQQSAAGNLTSFSGLFSVTELSVQEKKSLSDILTLYALDDHHPEQDLEQLIALTSEVKAINNQAALLHGERIKKAQLILTHYREGAFSAWLMATYGNRQTPYNLMHYYEFCSLLSPALRTQIELMPRQAVYMLASRQGKLEEKQQLVKNYQGQTKQEMIALIQQTFPLDQTDKRQLKKGHVLLKELKHYHSKIKQTAHLLTHKEKQLINQLVEEIKQFIKN